MADTRKITGKIIDAIGEGRLDRDTVIKACLNYMSEADVEDMACANDFFDMCTECAGLDGEHASDCKVAHPPEEDDEDEDEDEEDTDDSEE